MTAFCQMNHCSCSYASLLKVKSLVLFYRGKYKMNIINSHSTFMDQIKKKIIVPYWSKQLCIGKESFYLWKIWYLILNLRNSFFGQSTGVCHLIWSRWKIILKQIAKQLWLLSSWTVILKIWENFCILKKRKKKKRNSLFLLTGELFPQSWEKQKKMVFYSQSGKAFNRAVKRKDLYYIPIAIMNFMCSLD